MLSHKKRPGEAPVPGRKKAPGLPGKILEGFPEEKEPEGQKAVENGKLAPKGQKGEGFHAFSLPKGGFG